jgi:hypothetical protein
MGWASGSDLCEDLYRDVKRFVAKEDFQEVARIFIEHFESHDCDTLCEVSDKDFKKAYNKLYPEDN